MKKTLACTSASIQSSIRGGGETVFQLHLVEPTVVSAKAWLTPLFKSEEHESGPFGCGGFDNTGFKLFSEFKCFEFSSSRSRVVWSQFERFCFAFKVYRIFCDVYLAQSAVLHIFMFALRIADELMNYLVDTA